MSKEKNSIPYDYSVFQENKADQTDVLGKISALADEMHSLDKTIAEKELELKKVKENRRQIAQEQLPELFNSVGMSELKTLSGLPLKLSNKIFTSISQGRKPTAIAWLDANGQGGMIKRCVVIDFDKTQTDKVDALLRLIGKGWPNHRVSLDVHAATVKSFVKKALEDGENIPMDVFGVHCVDEVEIKSK